MNIQNTKKENIVDDINGILVQDPYRWLEDAINPEVQEWIKIQNQYTDSILKNETFNKFSNELIKNFEAIDFSNPFPVNGRYFYRERKPGENQMALYVKFGLLGIPIKLVDPNNNINGISAAMDHWSLSHTGKYVAYGISEGGNEMSTLYVIDVDNNINLSEKIINCRHSSISWLVDDSGFFYTRNPRPDTVPKNEEHLHTKVYFHKLGDNPENDKLIFGADRPKDDMLSLSSLSPDGKYLGIQVSRKWTENEVYIYNQEMKEIKPFIINIPSHFSLSFLNDKVLLFTNYKANNYRILWNTYNDLYKPLDQWKEFIPEREFLLESLKITKSKILVEYLVNACSKVVLFDYEGKMIEDLPLPEFSSLAGISASREEEEFFYGVNSFLFPQITYHYSPEQNKYSIYRKTDNPIDPQNYEVKQEWYESKDGTKVPMFIFHKKDILDKPNPTIIYGYGGFGSNETPGFIRNWVPWIKEGGIFAIANIRGGGEFGEKWHKQGMKENKQNSFDDFIAAGEYLIKQGYTDKDHLGIRGVSNGGLLVSAVAVQRPDLFKAVCSQVPLTDMVRFPLFGMALRWVHEYGDPKVEGELENILKWSPYHNVKEGIEYPNFLFITGENDTRVDPLHSRKMAAILQSVNKVNQVFIFTEMEAGHGAGKPIKKIVESMALILTFFADKLGLKE